jgi:hypothetical protein
MEADSVLVANLPGFFLSEGVISREPTFLDQDQRISRLQFHFSVADPTLLCDLVEEHEAAKSFERRQFHDFFWDCSSFALLKNKLWLRQRLNLHFKGDDENSDEDTKQTMSSKWSLKYTPTDSESRNSSLCVHEFKDDDMFSAISKALKRSVSKDNINKLFPSCITSMNTERMYLFRNESFDLYFDQCRYTNNDEATVDGNVHHGDIFYFVIGGRCETGKHEEFLQQLGNYEEEFKVELVPSHSKVIARLYWVLGAAEFKQQIVPNIHWDKLSPPIFFDSSLFLED